MMENNKLKNKEVLRKNLEKLCIAICVMFSIVRLCVNFKTAYFIRPDFGSDDGLLFNYASNLSAMKWLGEYNWQTLVKGISYPITLAFCQKTAFPYPLVISVLDIAAAFSIVWAIKEKVSSICTLCFTYLLVLFNPIRLCKEVCVNTSSKVTLFISYMNIASSSERHSLKPLCTRRSIVWL
ncbi:hypothetical protein SAMN04487761_1402 [Lachnospiraceae bacterium C7]|nr:hypothetical protein SAMN04487761_1402 [Lachnospiraceae bacterium C7]